MADRTFIEEDLKTIKEEYNGLTKNHLFSLWVLTTFHYGGDTSESTLDDVYQRTYSLLEEGFPGDFGLDGYYYDEDQSSIYLYQCKWPDTSKKVASAADVDEIPKALTILDNLIENQSNLPDTWVSVITALKEVKNDNGKIFIRGVTSGRWSSKHLERLKLAVPSHLKELVEAELYDLKDLHTVIHARDDDLSGEKAIFKLFEDTTDSTLLVPSMGIEGIYDSAVALLSAKNIAEISKKYKNALFEKNVRLFLGSGNRNKDVLNQIITSDDTRRAFWYGHNGITILCDKFDFKPNNSKPVTIDIVNPQIVNGCQTVNTINIAFTKELEPDDVCDFPVLARIIKITNDAELRDSTAGSIAYATNNQSAVNDSDLRSNDPKQIELQLKLQKFDKKWFYERKRGEWKNLVKHKKAKYKEKNKDFRLIDKDLYQQSWRAYNGNPSAAISKKNLVWVRHHGKGNDLYDEVFGTHIRPCDVVLVCVLFNWFKPIFQVDNKNNSSYCVSIKKGLRNNLDKISRAKNLVVTHSIAMFGYIVSKAYENDVSKYDEEFIKIIINRLDRKGYVKKNWAQSGKKKNWKVLEDCINIIFTAWYTYLIALKDESLLVSLRRKDEEAFFELKKYIDDEIEGNYLELVTPK